MPRWRAGVLGPEPLMWSSPHGYHLPYRWGQRGSDRLGGMSKVAKLGNGALGTQTRVF